MRKSDEDAFWKDLDKGTPPALRHWYKKASGIDWDDASHHMKGYLRACWLEAVSKKSDALDRMTFLCHKCGGTVYVFLRNPINRCYAANCRSCGASNYINVDRMSIGEREEESKWYEGRGPLKCFIYALLLCATMTLLGWLVYLR
jgi:hypothetical protein